MFSTRSLVLAAAASLLLPVARGPGEAHGGVAQDDSDSEPQILVLDAPSHIDVLPEDSASESVRPAADPAFHLLARGLGERTCHVRLTIDPRDADAADDASSAALLWSLSWEGRSPGEARGRSSRTHAVIETPADLAPAADGTLPFRLTIRPLVDRSVRAGARLLRLRVEGWLGSDVGAEAARVRMRGPRADGAQGDIASAPPTGVPFAPTSAWAGGGGWPQRLPVPRMLGR